MKRTKILRSLPAVVLAATPALASGPAFLSDISISDLAGTPSFTFIDSSAGEADWVICIDAPCSAGTPGVSEAFHLLWQDGAPEGLPFVIEHNTNDFLLYLDSNERVGIGTSTPGSSLEIRSASPEITLDDTSGGAGEAYFELNNNDATLEGNGGTDIIEYDVRAPATLDVDFLGTTTILNDLQVNSSRASKTALEGIDGGEILSRLIELPIWRWSYKAQGADVRHLGPMAEDFHAVFSLGDKPSAISVVDLAGVALAATQELASRLSQLEDENRRLERRLARLEGGLAPTGVAASR